MMVHNPYNSCWKLTCIFWKIWWLEDESSLFWKGPFARDIRSFLGGRYTHKLIWNIYFGESTKIKACKRWLLPFPQKDSKSKVERLLFEQKQAWHYGLQLLTPDTSSHICSPSTQFWTPHRHINRVVQIHVSFLAVSGFICKFQDFLLESTIFFCCGTQHANGFFTNQTLPAGK